jgi:hypothetical protein
MKNLVKNSLV